MHSIFKNPNQLASAKNLLISSVKISTFADNAYYNPFRDSKDSHKIKLMEVEETLKVDKQNFTKVSEYNIVTVTTSRIRNILSGRTDITDGIVAGTFIQTLTFLGQEQYINDWDMFLQDYNTSLVPADMFKVYEMLQHIAPNIEITKPEDTLDKTASHMITMWEHNLASEPNNFCATPKTYQVYKEPKLYKSLKDAVGKQSTVMSRFLSLGSLWRVGDAYTALCWCIAARVHPVRLLNFIGYYLTHKSNQPIAFSRVISETQLYEVPIVEEGSTKVIGYKSATSQFSAGFINEFSRMIRDIDFKSNPIDEEFISLTLRFTLEDFSAPDTLAWQSVPLDSDAAEYYTLMGITEENAYTVRELEQKVVKRSSSKRDKQKLEATGNPLFDIAMIQNNEHS